MTKANPDDTFRILIATDIHLGYQHERNKGQPLNDSFTTFEEILQYGKKYQVDFILLGGDLFHDTKPSQTAMVECMDLLRKYCYGSGDVKMEFLTDPSKVFEHCRYKSVNYEDPNMNVNMPIFTIHGNHDDPNFSSVGSMDILSVTGLVNYFGKWMSVDKLTIEPIVLKKGSTHISLYGMGFVNDQRLHRLIKNNKLVLKEVEEIPECFNILVLHQNRVQHSLNDFVPENKLPRFLNLIIWGHEHECRIEPESVAGVPYLISQPGSSIATSLCQNETVPKHVGLLSINKLRFKIKKLKLNTVRPFVLDTINLYKNPEIEERRNADCANPNIIITYVDEYIEHKILPKVLTQYTGHPKQPKEPLVRLRIFYKDENDLFETTGLGQKYCDEVLNPMSMILFRKISDNSKSSRDEFLNSSLDDVAEKFQFEDEETGWTQSVQGTIKEYFNSEENRNLLTVLSVGGLNETLSQYIIKADEDAIQDVIQNQISKNKDYLKKCNLKTPEEIIGKLKEYRDERNQKENEECQDVINFLQSRSSKRTQKRTQADNNDSNDSNDDNDDIDEIVINDSNDEMHDNERSKSVASKAKGKKTTSARGRASSRGTTGRSSRGSKTNSMNKSVKEFFTSKNSDIVPNKRKQSEQMQSTRSRQNTASSSQYSRLNVTNVFLDDSD
ncbi:double-strand break repair protein MRE11 isoform X2 [Polistes fuscatus]|uniref:double-strand break repair protein MRE11 isoform X2 n=1 Tax=Polistes fuscatus TaxID=30207 RepID=UPI001CA89CD7|nr:double-strand break repair protein MRE11 isoform X2 [Polistes fuscatus]XP_043488905.1 double-strand break repair protein MRE11 isoform X2 [Polistes fuscatus]